MLMYTVIPCPCHSFVECMQDEWIGCLVKEQIKLVLGKQQKKVLLLMAGPLRPNPPPPSSLMAVETLER